MDLALDLLGFGVNVLAATAVKTAEYVASKAKSAAMDKMPENRPMAKRIKAIVQNDIDQLKETLKKRIESLAESNLRAAIASVKDALIIMETHNNNNNNVEEQPTESHGFESRLIPNNLHYVVPAESLNLLDHARNLAQLAWSDRENVSVPMRLEAMKVLLFCMMLRYKDKPEALVGLIGERIKALSEDAQLKSILDKKVSRFFLFNKQSTLDAKAAIATFTRQLMCTLPGLYKLGYRLRDVPPFLTSVTSHACMPVGWWAGHPVLCVNGSLLCDLPWTHKILVGDFDGTTKLLDLETFEFQATYDVWLESNAVVDDQLREVYTNRNVLKWSDKKQTFKLKHDCDKGASYSRIDARALFKSPAVISPLQKHAVLLTDDGLYIRWALEFVGDNEHDLKRTLPADHKKCLQMFTRLDVDDLNDIKRLLWLDDGQHDDAFLYVLKFNDSSEAPEMWRYQIRRDSKTAVGSKLFNVPGSNPDTELDFYHDLLCWSDINEACVAVSLNNRSLFQFRLIDLDTGRPSDHSVVWVKDFSSFPPKFNWRQVSVDNLKPNKVTEKMIYKRSPVMRDGCIFVCMPFDYALKQQQFANMKEEVKNYQPLGRIIS